MLRPGEGLSSKEPITYPLRLSFDGAGNCYVMKVENVFGTLKHPIRMIYNTGRYILFNCVDGNNLSEHFTSRVLNGSKLMGLLTDAPEK